MDMTALAKSRGRSFRIGWCRAMEADCHVVPPRNDNLIGERFEPVIDDG